jgi:hypothetical protein
MTPNGVRQAIEALRVPKPVWLDAVGLPGQGAYGIPRVPPLEAAVAFLLERELERMEGEAVLADAFTFTLRCSRADIDHLGWDRFIEESVLQLRYELADKRRKMYPT